MIFVEETFTDCSLLPCQRVPRPKISWGKNVMNSHKTARNLRKFSLLKVSHHTVVDSTVKKCCDDLAAKKYYVDLAIKNISWGISAVPMPALRSTRQQDSPFTSQITVLPHQSHDLPCLDVERESGHCQWQQRSKSCFYHIIECFTMPSCEGRLLQAVWRSYHVNLLSCYCMIGFIKSNQLCAGISSGYPIMPMLYCVCVWSTRGWRFDTGTSAHWPW